MKKFLIGLLFAGSLFTACSGGKGRLKVSIQGLTDDSLICSYITPEAVRELANYTVVLVGGKRSDDRTEFSVDLPDARHSYRIFLAPQSFVGDGPNQNIELFLAPGERVEVQAVYDPQSKAIEYTLVGSDDQQRWLDAEKEFEPLRLRIEMLSMMAQILSPERRGIEDSVFHLICRLADSMNQIKAEYITAHPADPVSGYHLLTLSDADRFDSLYHRLDPGVRNGAVKEWLELYKEMNDLASSVEKGEHETAAEEGSMAPDFTLPDRAGEAFTLSSLYGQGKYIVIDFWGAWCGWCMRGMPAMKEAYGKYDGAVEFVGIDCGDKEETWRRTVEEQALPWINVRADETSDVAQRFGVEGFPTKLILDPQGKIVVRITGEDPAFYSTLDSLIARQR